jgi:hypothetical protein
MTQSSNGQPLPQPERERPRRHNAKRCKFATRQAIIYALANHESVESIRRNYHLSRHIVLAVRDQYPHEIEAAQQRIKELIEVHYLDAQIQALRLIEQKMAECSILQLAKVSDWITDRMMALETPVQAHPQPLSIKLAALRRSQRNESCDRSMWHEAET